MYVVLAYISTLLVFLQTSESVFFKFKNPKFEFRKTLLPRFENGIHQHIRISIQNYRKKPDTLTPATPARLGLMFD